MPAEPGAEERDDLIADRNVRHALAHRIHDARAVHAEHADARPPEADRRPGEGPDALRHFARAGAMVGGAHRRRVHPDADLARAGRRSFELLELDNLGAAERGRDGGEHPLVGDWRGCDDSRFGPAAAGLAASLPSPARGDKLRAQMWSRLSSSCAIARALSSSIGATMPTMTIPQMIEARGVVVHLSAANRRGTRPNTTVCQL